MTMDQNAAVRAHIVKALDWQEAHVGFDKAVAGLQPELRGRRPLIRRPFLT